MMMSSYDSNRPVIPMRTIVDLPGEQVAALQQLGVRSNLSRAELVRRAVAEYLDKRQDSGDERAFGLWQRRHCDALDYEDQLRAEWAS